MDHYRTLQGRRIDRFGRYEHSGHGETVPCDQGWKRKKIEKKAKNLLPAGFEPANVPQFNV